MIPYIKRKPRRASKELNQRCFLNLPGRTYLQ